jgi:quercetin dioxygenase-like cupin family protein
MNRFALTLGVSLIVCIPAAAQDAPVQVEQEPRHHVLLKNDDIMVVHATIPPGDLTLYHIHSHNRGGVSMLKSTGIEQVLGKAEGSAETTQAGEVWIETISSDHPLVHRIRNTAQTPYDMIDVEFLGTPSATPPPAAAKVEAENASGRIYKWTLAAGASSPTHTHQRPYLILATTPMHLQMSAPEGAAQSEDVKPGDFHWVTVPVTHTLKNTGADEGEIVEFELK